MKSRTRLIAMLAVIVLATTSCNSAQETISNQVLEQASVSVAVSKIEKNKTIENKMSYASKVSPAESVSIMSKMTGKVSEIYYDVADTVKKGDILFRLDEQDVKNQIAQLESQLAISEQSVAQAQSALNAVTGGQYQSTLLQIDGQIDAAVKQTENAQIGVENAQFSLGNAQIGIDNAQIGLENAQIGLDNAKNSLDGAKLGLDNAQIGLKNAKISQEAAKLGLENAQIGLDNAKAAKQNVEDSLESATSTYEDMEVLYKAGVISRSEFEKVELSLKQAKTAYEQASNALSQAQLGYDQAQLTYSQTDLGLEQAQLAHDQAKLTYDKTELAYGQAELVYGQAKLGHEQAQLAYEQSKLSPEQAQLAYEQAKQSLEKTKENKSLTVGKITDENIERAKISLAQAEASRDSVKVQLEIAKDTLNDTAVKSPIDGTISAKTVKVGEFTSPQVAAFTIVNIDKINVETKVSERLVNSLNLGDKVEVLIKSATETPFIGQIISVAPAADQTNMYPIKLELLEADSNNKVKPGMFAEVYFVGEKSENTIVVNRDAVLGRKGEEYVFINNNGYAKKVTVLTGIDNGYEIEILEGVSEGTYVIESGQDYLSDKDKLNIVDAIEVSESLELIESNKEAEAAKEE